MKATTIVQTVAALGVAYLVADNIKDKWDAAARHDIQARNTAIVRACNREVTEQHLTEYVDMVRSKIACLQREGYSNTPSAK